LTLLLGSRLALWCGMTLLLWGRLALRRCLTLLLLRSRLTLMLLWGSHLTLLLLLLNCLVLLLLLLSRLVLLLLLGSHLSLLLLHLCLIVDLHSGWHSDVAIRGDWPVDCQIGRTAVVDVGKLRAVAAGSALVLHLRAHGRSVLFMPGSQLRGSGPHLQSA